MRTLLLMPPADPGATAGWGYAWADDGTVGDSGHTSLDLLPRPARGQACVLVWPTQRLSWQRVTLPTGSLGRNRSGARLRQILDGLLEDQLLQDTAGLHLALAPDATEAQPVWVAVTARAALQQALGVLAQAGVPVQRVLPQAVPDQAGAHLGGPDHAPSLRLGWPLAQDAHARCPVQVALDAHSPALYLGCGEAGALSAEPAVAARATALGVDTPVLCSAAAQAAQCLPSGWNLAQMGLTLHTGWRTRLAQAGARWLTEPRWRPTRWALVALLLVQIVGLNGWAWLARHSLDAQRAQLRAVFTQSFPDKPVVDPLAQMVRELQVLRQQRGSESGLNALLATLASVAPPPYALQAIRYTDRTWQLQGPPLPNGQADALRQRWQAAGWTVQGGVDGRWTLTGGGTP